MLFGKDGFLAADIGMAVQEHRKHYHERFALAERLNRNAQAMLATTVAPVDRQLLVMLLFFARAVSNYQGAVILAERGMTVEARILARACLESSFCIGATSNDPTFIDQLITASQVHKEKIAKWAKSVDPSLVEFSANQLDGFNRFLDELQQSGVKLSQIIIRAVAKSANMDDLYQTLYRDLSNGAAHPTLDAVSGFLDTDDTGTIVGLYLGPNPKDIEQTLSVSETALFCAMSFMLEKFPNEGFEQEMSACWDIQKKLGAEMVARLNGQTPAPVEDRPKTG